MDDWRSKEEKRDQEGKNPNLHGSELGVDGRGGQRAGENFVSCFGLDPQQETQNSTPVVRPGKQRMAQWGLEPGNASNHIYNTAAYGSNGMNACWRHDVDLPHESDGAVCFID